MSRKTRPHPAGGANVIIGALPAPIRGFGLIFSTRPFINHRCIGWLCLSRFSADILGTKMDNRKEDDRRESEGRRAGGERCNEREPYKRENREMPRRTVPVRRINDERRDEESPE